MKDIHNSQDILRAALETFGAYAQTWKCIEEMGELQQAFGKLKSGASICGEFMTLEEKKKAYDHLQEEIADCIIMLAQMRILYGTEGVDKWIDYKLNRLEERLSEEDINRWVEEAMI